MNENYQEVPAEESTIRIIRMKDLVNKVGLCRGTIYKKMKLGIFPQSFNITNTKVGWREDEVNEWIFAQQANRDIG